MNPLLNVLKAIGIALGWYLLLFAGCWVILTVRFGKHWLADFGLKDMPPEQQELSFGVLLVLALPVLPFFLAFAALYLPPQGRMYAAIGALSVLVVLWIWFGVKLFNAPFN